MAKILFIEDEPALQSTLSNYLKGEGYDVTSASDGEEGLKLCSEIKPDLLLLDLVLPKKQGVTVLEELRGQPNFAALPVIVLTNVESNESVERAMELGAKAYLVKTNYALEEVGAKVREVLGEQGK